MLSQARALCNGARLLLECTALKALNMVLIRRSLAFSWRSLYLCNTTSAVALCSYIRARRMSSSIWLLSLVFVVLALRLFRDAFSFCRRSASFLFALCFCFCRNSAFAFAGSLHLVSARTHFSF